MECYICFRKTYHRSPCPCRAHACAACLALARRKGFVKCSICQRDYEVFEWTPVYLRDGTSAPRAYREEFVRTSFFIYLVYITTGNVLRAALKYMVCVAVCLCLKWTQKWVLRWRQVQRYGRDPGRIVLRHYPWRRVYTP